MQTPPTPPPHLIGDPPPPPSPPPEGFPWLSPDTAPAPATRRLRRPPMWAAAIPVAAAVALFGVMLGGRASAEDARSAAATALSGGDPARAVSLDEAVAGRGGFLMVLDPGAAADAAHDAQVARIAWAKQLAAGRDVDGAVAALTLVRQPSLLGQAAQARAQILIDAASAAAKSGHAALALRRLDQAGQGNPPGSMVQTIASMRAADEVKAAAELSAANRAADAVALLDDASNHGGGAAAAPAYPATLLAAAQSEIAAADYQDALTALHRLVNDYGSSAQARSARSLLNTPQRVSGTLVDAAGHGVSGRVRLSTHFTQLSGGYVTTGPFYYGTADGAGDFSIDAVPVGGPYTLEYLRDGGWMTLIDPHSGQPANPVTVTSLAPEDLTFIIIP